MLNKQKIKWVWCDYSGYVNTTKSLIRCPKCNKRLEVYDRYLELATEQDSFKCVSRHKRKVKKN